MIALAQLTDAEFERHALEVLRRELGPSGLARFLRLHRSGTGDYTKERAPLQKQFTVRQVAADFKKNPR
jgi:hypothetical protein